MWRASARSGEIVDQEIIEYRSVLATIVPGDETRARPTINR
jgi:hypothetical protein